MKITFVFIFLLSFIFVSSQRLRIPNRLIHCYRGNFTETWYPSSLPMVIDIIRKIEEVHPISTFLRHFSSRLFHDLRVDGIQRSHSAIETEDVTVFGVTGFMAQKNRVMQQIISNASGGDINYEAVLTPDELCTLHKLISSSVEPHEMHNENQICPWEILNTTSHIPNSRRIPQPLIPDRRHFNNHTLVGPNLSRCPIEMGVMYNDYGSFHLGNIIAAIASGMQPQNIRISDFVAEYRENDPFANLETMEETDNKQKIAKVISSLSSVDNTYASGLAGDLAETILFQAPLQGSNLTIGFSALWNDTNFPRLLHLNGSGNALFHLTDSEILSGLDSLLISQQVSSWTSRISRLRLSQILDMYYQHQGVSIPIIQTATNNRNKEYGGRKPPSGVRKNLNDDDNDLEIAPKFDGKTLFRKAFNYKVINEELDDDMNYLSRFSIVEGINSVCHRQKIIEMIDVDKLKDETYNFIQILQMVTRTPIISEELLKELTTVAVERLIDYSRKLVAKNKKCENEPINIEKSSIDMTLIIDGSRSQYENTRLVNFISELIGVSIFGSYISVVSGNGRYLVNRTNTISNAFGQLRNSSFDNPASLSLSTTLGNIMLTLQNQSLEEKGSGVFLALPKVILVISQAQRISQMDFESAQRIILGSMLQFPDLYFIFLTNDVKSFKDLTSRDGAIRITSGRMLIETAERYRFIEAHSTELSSFKKSLEDAVKSIPKRIVSPYCRDYNSNQRNLLREEFEDYASPNVELKYRISPFYLYGSNEIRVRFQSVGYGDLTICMARNQQMTNKECHSIQDIENVWFNITQPCMQVGNDECLSIYFTVLVDTTYIRCTENSCRFPDDVRFNVRPEGMRCEQNDELANATSIKLSLFIVLLMFVIRRILD